MHGRDEYFAEINIFHYPSNAPARQLTSLPRLCYDLQGGSQNIASWGRFSVSALQFEPFNTSVVLSLQYRKSDICCSLASYRLVSCRYSLPVVSNIDRSSRFGYRAVVYTILPYFDHFRACVRALSACLSFSVLRFEKKEHFFGSWISLTKTKTRKINQIKGR